MDVSLGAYFYFTLFIFILEKQSADCNVCSSSFPITDHALSGHVWKAIHKQTFERCIFSCELDPKCFSVNFHTERKLCELNLGTLEAFRADFVQRKGSVYISMVVRRFDPCVTAELCKNGGRCEPYPVTRCICPEGYSGLLCEGLSPLWYGHQYRHSSVIKTIFSRKAKGKKKKERKNTLQWSEFRYCARAKLLQD